VGIPRQSSWLRRAGEVSVLASAAYAMAPVVAQDSRLGPLGIALVLAFLVLSLGIHEAAHAWVAWRCGDSTAKDLGRMTLNPIPHIDPWLTIIIPGLLMAMGAPIFGGAKPVPVSYHRLRHPLRDMALVAVAGPATNFLLAILFMVAWKWSVYHGGYAPDSLMALVLANSVVWNIMLTAFNLLPIPPLDGSRVMTWLLPASIRDGYASLERFGILLVILVINVPAVRGALYEMYDGIENAIRFLTSGIA
jgi:Zn-dependent protease